MRKILLLIILYFSFDILKKLRYNEQAKLKRTFCSGSVLYSVRERFILAPWSRGQDTALSRR